jgi:glycosyltransferase involved in cell wall biosynthesis
VVRVLFVLGSLGGGGAERQVLTWLRHLDRTRFAPTLYLIARRGELLAELPHDIPVTAFEDRHSPPRLYVPGRIYRRQAHDLAEVASEGHFDVIVSVAMQMTLLAAAMPQRPAGWLAVEMADPRQDFVAQAKRFRFLKYRQLIRAYSQAVPVAVSQGVKEGISTYFGTPPQQITVLPNFIDLEEIERRAQEPGPVLAPDRLHIVTVGRFHPQKGHRDLLLALAQLVHRRGMDQVQLHLLGQGELRDELEALVQDERLDSQVTFAGFVTNPLAYVRQCDLFCLSSHYEGLPLALLEAMALGIPVVATDCESGPREALAGGAYGRLVPVGDPVALAEAIEAVANDLEAARAIAQTARQHVAENYSVQVGIARLERLLLDVAGP